MKNLSKNEALAFFKTLLEMNQEDLNVELQSLFNKIGMDIIVEEARDVADNFILKQVETWGLSKEVLPDESLKEILTSFAPKSWLTNHIEIANRLPVKDLLTLMDSTRYF